MKLNAKGRRYLRSFLHSALTVQAKISGFDWEEDVTFDPDTGTGYIEIGPRYSKTGNPVTHCFYPSEIDASDIDE